MKNFAFIDAQNLNLGISSDVVNKKGEITYSGWKLDLNKFRIYLKEKYHVEKACLFMGYVSKYKRLYKRFEEHGFTLIFKETTKYKNGNTKGNVDTELVLHAAAIEFENYDKAIIVSGDGDFACLIDFLQKHKKLKMLLVPNQYRYSGLLKKSAKNKIAFVSRLKHKFKKLNS